MTFEPIEVSEERSCAWRLSFDDKAPRLDVTLGAAIEVFTAFWPLVRPVEIRLAFVHWLDGKHLADVHHRAIAVDASWRLERIVAALVDTASSVPANIGAATRDLMSLSVDRAFVRLDDPPSSPERVSLAKPEYTALTTQIDGATYLSTHHPEVGTVEPLMLWLGGTPDLFVTSYWAPWMTPGTASHDAVDQAVRRLTASGAWTLEEKRVVGGASR